MADHVIPAGATQRGRKHLLVREYVRSLIVDAEPGSPAPSERDLVEQFGVARMTVRHALDVDDHARTLAGQKLAPRETMNVRRAAGIARLPNTWV